MVGNYKINHFFYFIDGHQLYDSLAVYMFIDHLSVLCTWWTEKDSVNFIVNILQKIFYTFILFFIFIIGLYTCKYTAAVVFWKGVSFKSQSDRTVASKRLD